MAYRVWEPDFVCHSWNVPRCWDNTITIITELRPADSYMGAGAPMKFLRGAHTKSHFALNCFLCYRFSVHIGIRALLYQIIFRRLCAIILESNKMRWMPIISRCVPAEALVLHAYAWALDFLGISKINMV